MEFFYLFPIILEAIDFKRFPFIIGISPISVGAFMILVFGFLHYKSYFLSSNLMKSFLVIFVAIFISGLLTDSPLNNFTRTLANLALIISSIGFAKYLFEKGLVFKLHIYFLAMLFYWVYYVLSLYFSGQITGEAHFNSTNQDIDTINSHTVCIAISTAIIFIFTYYIGQKNNKFILIGLGLFAIAIFAMIIAQSRSNVMFTLFVGSIAFALRFVKKISLKQFIFSAILFISLIVIVSKIGSLLGDEETNIGRRFNIEETEYQESTTENRRIVYLLFFERLKTNFWGTGIVNIKLYIGSESATNLMMHDQYITWALAGGWIGVIGVIMLLIALIKYFTLFFSLIRKLPVHIVSLNLAMLVYFITLFTVEQGGIFFFIFTGLLIYQHTIYFKTIS